MKTSLAHLSDHTLLSQVKHLAQREREATATLVAHLAEVNRRRLFLAEGTSSMFKYCTQVLHLSEHATYLRLEAACMSQRFPAILPALESGALSLSAIKLLAPELTDGNCDELINAARHRSKSEIEALLARRHPRPDVPNIVRKLPARPAGEFVAVGAPAPGAVGVEGVAHAKASEVVESEAFGLAQAAVAAPETRAARSVIAPLAPERYKVQFTASAELHAKIRRAQDLLRHRIPDGDLAQVFDLALTALVERLEKQKLAMTDRPRQSRGVKPGSRVIPAHVKRAVFARDGGRCAFVGKSNRRCNETGFLEFHHVVPFARGGEATVANIHLRCRAHNQYEAILDFGQRDWGVVRELDTSWDGVVREVSLAWRSARSWDSTRSGPSCEIVRKVELDNRAI